MEFLNLDFSIIHLSVKFLYLNDFNEFLKIFEILYYENMEFLNLDFLIIHLSDKFLYLNYFDKFLKFYTMKIWNFQIQSSLLISLKKIKIL